MSAAYGFGTSQRCKFIIFNLTPLESPGVTKETAYIPGPGSYKANGAGKKRNPSWV